MGNPTQIVECGRLEEYEMDDCDICDFPVLRPIEAPPGAKPVCSKCLPEVMAAAEKIRKHMIMSDGTITEGAN